MILKTAALKEKHGSRAEGWLKLAADIFTKWETRGCWREVKDGGLWVVPGFGLEEDRKRWTEGYARRTTDGFSNPANKPARHALVPGAENRKSGGQTRQGMNAAETHFDPAKRLRFIP